MLFGAPRAQPALATASTLDSLMLAAGTHTYTGDGLYEPTLTVTDGDSVEHTKTALVNAAPLPDFGGKWGGMKTALAAGRVDEAAGHIASQTREQYRANFQILEEAGLLRFAAEDVGDFVLTKMLGDAGMGEMVITADGVAYSYSVIFVKDDDGIWRIQSF
ncbi:MAG: PKD domain-containing protein [Nitrospirae bacterium]|nr:PKD domain-containing protein [Nitrospirota bacterium]